MTNDKSMNMDSEPSDNFEHASGETISEKENTVKTEVKSVIKDIPPVISPINSPVKPKENTTEEVRLMICAPDQLAAENVAKQLPRHIYMGPKKNSKLHFVFSTQLTPIEILEMKKDTNKIIKLPIKNSQIVNFYVFNEDKVYNPEENHNCPGKS